MLRVLLDWRMWLRFVAFCCWTCQYKSTFWLWAFVWEGEFVYTKQIHIPELLPHPVGPDGQRGGLVICLWKAGLFTPSTLRSWKETAGYLQCMQLLKKVRKRLRQVYALVLFTVLYRGEHEKEKKDRSLLPNASEMERLYHEAIGTLHLKLQYN